MKFRRIQKVSGEQLVLGVSGNRNRRETGSFASQMVESKLSMHDAFLNQESLCIITRKEIVQFSLNVKSSCTVHGLVITEGILRLKQHKTCYNTVNEEVNELNIPDRFPLDRYRLHSPYSSIR